MSSPRKTIVVIGATGDQGGSVVDRLLQFPKTYKVRAITRTPESSAAEELRSKGVEVMFSDVNNPFSLEILNPCLRDAYAIFAVTAYWPSFETLGAQGAGEEELQQFKNMAKAANKVLVKGLKHFIISTQPSVEEMTNGRVEVPHLDFKARAAKWIRQEYPELWGITTEFWPTMYTQNFFDSPVLKPIELVSLS